MDKDETIRRNSVRDDNPEVDFILRLEDSQLLQELDSNASDTATSVENTSSKLRSSYRAWESFNSNKLEERERNISKWTSSENTPENIEYDDSLEENVGSDCELNRARNLAVLSLYDTRRWDRRLRLEVFDQQFVSRNEDINEEMKNLCRSFGFERDTNSLGDNKDILPEPEGMLSDLYTWSTSSINKIRQNGNKPSRSDILVNDRAIGGSFALVQRELLKILEDLLSREIAVLKQGPIMLEERDLFQLKNEEKLYELIVLSEAFLISKIHISNEKITRQIKHCDEIKNIVSVIDLDFTDLNISPKEDMTASGIQIIVPGGSYAFSCNDINQKLSWIRTLEFAIVNQEKYKNETKKEIGRQHFIMRTSIHSAAWVGDDEMLEIILESYEDQTSLVDLPDADGFSAIHYAILQKNVSCVTLLLEAGCDPNKLSSQLKSPAKYCEFGGVIDEDISVLNNILKLLEEHGSKDAGSIIKKNDRKSKSMKYTMTRMFTSFRKKNDEIENMNLRNSDNYG